MKTSIAPGYPAIRSIAAAVALAAAAAIAPAFAQQAPGASPGAPPAAAAAVPEQSDPRRVAAAVARVQALRKDGRTQEALQELELALRAAPRDAQLRFLYGVTVAEAGRRDDAIAVFEQLTADFPELPEPHNNLAVMHAAVGDLDRARAALENAVRALPGYALAHENLGDVYLRMAERSWERASRADARNRSAPAKLALARELLQRVALPASGAGSASAQPATTQPPATQPASPSRPGDRAAPAR
jgi:tetratricopeptide (TPR) repeat protein